MEPFVCDVVGIERLGGSELAGEGSPSAHRAHLRARARNHFAASDQILLWFHTRDWSFIHA